MTTHADIISRVNRINPQYRSLALMRQIQLLEYQHEQFLRRIHDVEVIRRSDNTRVHRYHSRNSTLGLRDDRWLRFNGHHYTHNRAHNSTSRRPQPRRPGALQPQLVPISRRPVNPRRPRILQPFPVRRPTHHPTVHVPARRPTLPANRIQDYHQTHYQYPDDNMRTASLTSSSAQPSPNNEFFQDDQCNMIQMDYSAFDDAFNDKYFSTDTCNMIHLDATSEAEVPPDTVLYAASAKIVDTVRADHERLGHIPLLQLKKMIQENMVSPSGSSNKAQLLATFLQIKAAISKGFFCPTCAKVKNTRRTPAARVYPKATVYVDFHLFLIGFL